MLEVKSSANFTRKFRFCDDLISLTMIGNNKEPYTVPWEHLWFDYINHFTVVSLASGPLNESEAGGDLALKEILLLFLC